MLISKSIAAFIISLTSFVDVTAQQPCAKPQHGKLTGRLRDLCEVGIAKAAITAESGKIRRKFRSDKEGRFEACLPTGTYKLTVEKYGFKRYLVVDVEVTVGSTATVKVDMEAGYASNDPNAEKAPRKPCPPPHNGIRPAPRHAASHEG